MYCRVTHRRCRTWAGKTGIYDVIIFIRHKYLSGFCIEVVSVQSWINNAPLLIQRSIGFHKCPPSGCSFRLAEEVSEAESSLSALVPGADVAEVEGVVVPDAGADDALRLAVLDGEAGVHARADLAVLALERESNGQIGECNASPWYEWFRVICLRLGKFCLMKFSREAV